MQKKSPPSFSTGVHGKVPSKEDPSKSESVWFDETGIKHYESERPYFSPSRGGTKQDIKPSIPKEQTIETRPKIDGMYEPWKNTMNLSDPYEGV